MHSGLDKEDDTVVTAGDCSERVLSIAGTAVRLPLMESYGGRKTILFLRSIFQHEDMMGPA